MAEYYERESLIKAICKIGDDSKGSWSTSSIVDFLLNQPVANVEEVIWGHWERNEKFMRCSCCGCMMPPILYVSEGRTYKASVPKRCPNCEAKMKTGIYT